MSASRIEVCVLHVAQGMGTLVKIYEKKKLTGLALFDLGSDTPDDCHASDGVDFVMSALATMASTSTGSGTPRIDLLLVSHQDFDHWSLLPSLLSRIKSEQSSTKLGTLMFGGNEWLPKASATVLEFAKHFSVKPQPLASTSGYATPGTKTPVHSINGVDFLVLVTNISSRRAALDLERNTSSAAIVVEFGNSHFILPGDGTSETLGAAMTVLHKWEAAAMNNPVLPCIMMQAPHHGALRTLADNYNAKKPSLSIATDFIESYTKPRVVAASAGYESKHRHPSQRAMEVLSKKTTSGWGAHNFVVYDEANAKWLDMPSGGGTTKHGIFTSILATTGSPIRRETWWFDATVSGARAIGYYENVEGYPRHVVMEMPDPEGRPE